MTGSLKDQTVLVIGRGGGLARAIVLAARDEGAQAIAAGWSLRRWPPSTRAILASSSRASTSTPEEIAQGVLFALTNPFVTGQTLHIDGGEPLT